MADIREKLIAEVKSYPSLYDKTNEDYKKYELRVKAWTAIGRKLGLSASDAQAKWKNLRDNMVKHLKRNMNNTDGRKRVKQYKFAGMLDFIVPFLELTRVSELTDEANGGDLDCDDRGDNDARDEVESSGENTIPDGETSCMGVSTTGQSRSHSPSPSLQNSIAGPLPSKRRRRSLVNKSEPALFADHPPRQNVEIMDQDQDDIGMFLSSMAGSIRKLPPDVQAKVRFSIHKIVHDAEMEYLYPRLKGQ